ncbi:hypothetical protein G6700_03345 [Polynucleobacter paneuropaeus]|nr:hypothetical protein G6700_03345 [Polynucleobacter paneuropaeus]
MKFIRRLFGDKSQSSLIPTQAKVVKKYESPSELVDGLYAGFDFPKDLYSANKLIFGAFFYQSAPFTLWKDKTIDLPQNLEVITKVPCQFLMLRYWFWFLTSNYGSVVSGMLKDEFDNFVNELDNAEPKDDANFLEQINFYFTQIDEAIEHYEEIPEDKKSFKDTEGNTLVLPWEYYLALKVLMNSVDSPYYKVTDSDFDGNDNLVMGCLGYSKYVAEATYNKFKEHFVEFDAHTLKTWKWKKFPGLYEQQLIRRYNSPFFTKDEQLVSAYDVYIARLRDVTAWREFNDQYLKLKKEILDDESPANPIAFIADKREELDELIDKVDRLGLGKQGLDIQLRRLRESLIDIWMYIYKEQKNQSGLESLQKAEEFNKLNGRHNYPDFIKIMGHDSIPANEVMPSILSLNIRELKEVITYLESDDKLRDTLLNIRTGALDCVKQSLNQIQNLDEVKEKLRVIGVAL